MDTVLGLIGLVFYIAFIVGLAAGVTWIVVKVSPSKAQKQLEAKRQKQQKTHVNLASQWEVVRRHFVIVVAPRTFLRLQYGALQPWLIGSRVRSPILMLFCAKISNLGSVTPSLLRAFREYAR